MLNNPNKNAPLGKKWGMTTNQKANNMQKDNKDNMFNGDNTDPKPKNQGPLKVINEQGAFKPDVVTLKDRGNIDYDPEEVQRFFDTVFHTLEEDENILAWSQKSNVPVYPKTIARVMKQLTQTNLPKAFYFGTSTCHVHEDGNLYNRKQLFDRLHVMVLDDIGTKIPVGRLPIDLVPNYIIETSEGNYQYGYILKEPIDNLELAEAFIHLVYTSGLSDSGGKMPTKVVRMPCGINGKKGDKGDFRVRLVELNDDYWTPEELLDVMDVGVKWSDVVEDAKAATAGKTAMMSGTSAWSPVKTVAPCLNGVIDPLLEWLYEQDMVVTDNGEWVTVPCPWGHDHTSGGTTAGYSPVGRGGFPNMRAFHCFHDSCSANKTDAFLQLCATNGAPRVPIIDHVADLVADYAFVASENSAYKIRGVKRPLCVKMDAFKNLHPKKVGVYGEDGKRIAVAEHALWLNAPNRLNVHGMVYAPDQPYTIVKEGDTQNLNLYSPPEWGKGDYRKIDIDNFLYFLDYLIPTDSEREYFLDWLAMKAQNVTFKGAAILMVAPTQGTGRTTLTDMLATLFTPQNTKKVTFKQLCAVGDAGAYNEWQESLLVTCDEVMSQGSRHTVYENMKELFDPRPKNILINPKYGRQRFTTVYTSYIMLTNHEDAVGQLGGDRRIYVIENTLTPNTPQYFVDLNAWLNEKAEDGTPLWARSVWRWLQKRKPDINLMNAPAPETDGKRAMIANTQSVCDHFIEAVLETHNGLMPTSTLQELATDVFTARGDMEADKIASIAVLVAKKRTLATDARLRLNGKQTRIRISKAEMSSLGISGMKKSEYSEILHDHCVKTFNDVIAPMYEDYDKLVNKINDLIDALL